MRPHEVIPQQGWFARAYGWPHLYPRTAAQLLFRIAVTVVVGGVLFWLVQLLLTLGPHR